MRIFFFFIFVAGFAANTTWAAQPEGKGDARPSAAERKRMSDEAVAEAKQKRASEMRRIRKELPGLIEKLKAEKSLGKREVIVSDLGRSEDPRSVDPILQVLKDRKEPVMLRIRALEAMHDLHCASSPEGKLEAGKKREIAEAIKGLRQEESDPEMRCRMASLQYQLGSKEDAQPELLRCLRDGKKFVLNVFLYYRKEGNVLVNFTLLGSGETKTIDPDSLPIVQAAAGEDYPDPIRIRAIEMLGQLGQKDQAFSACTSLIKGGKDSNSRIDAMHLLEKLDKERAREIIESVPSSDPIRPSADMMLRMLWTK